LLIRRRVPVVPVVVSSSVSVFVVVFRFEELVMLPVLPELLPELLVPLVARVVPVPEVLLPEVPVEPVMFEREVLPEVLPDVLLVPFTPGPVAL
jgi:hypothetical protein